MGSATSRAPPLHFLKLSHVCLCECLAVLVAAKAVFQPLPLVRLGASAWPMLPYHTQLTFERIALIPIV